MFVIDLSTSVQVYFIHRLALLIWREKQVRTEGKTVYTYAEAQCLYFYNMCTVSLLLLSTFFSLNERRRDINITLCASSEHQRILF